MPSWLTAVTTAIVDGLVVPALWLWMARANGRGRNWARILSTALSGLATVDLPTILGAPVHSEVGVTEPGLVFVLTCLVGLAAVWLLWRPASSAFFKPQGFTQAGSGAQLSSRMNDYHGSHLPSQLSASALNCPASCWCMKWPPGTT